MLLYDGECGVCNGTVQWVLRYERPDTNLRFAALQSPLGAALREAAGIEADVDSLLWIENVGGRVRADVRSTAALRVASLTRGAWRWLSLFRIVPRSLRDFVYDAFAKIRHRVVSPSCLVPLPEQRRRFLA